MRLIPLLLATVSLTFSVTLDSFKGEKGTIRVAGGTAHIPVMKEVAKEIKSVNPSLKIAIEGGGSGVGIKKVGEGLVDIGNSGREPSKEEIEKYGLVLHKWAIDGISVVVNPKNGVTNLTKSEIKDLFTGVVTNWLALGGVDKPINIYTRDKASGTLKVFAKKVLDKESVVSSATIVNSNGAMKQALKSDIYGVGIMSAGFIDSTVKGVAIDSVAPTKENIQSGGYTVVRGLFSLTKGEAKGVIKTFIDYLMSDSVQKNLVPSKGFIPVK